MIKKSAYTSTLYPLPQATPRFIPWLQDKIWGDLGTRLPPPKDTENITPASTVASLPPFVSGEDLDGEAIACTIDSDCALEVKPFQGPFWESLHL